MDNFTQIPNKFMQEVALKTTTQSAIKVAYAVASKLYGFHKHEDYISNSQIVEMTGLSERTVRRAKKELQAAGLFDISGGDGRSHISRWGVKYSRGTKRKGDKGDPLSIEKEDSHVPLSLRKGDSGDRKRGTAVTPTKDNIYINTSSTSNEVLEVRESPSQEQGGTELPESRKQNKQDIDDCIAHLEQKLQASLDGSVRTNRRYCWLMIQKLRRDYPDGNPVDSIRMLIDIAIADDWHSQKLTSFKYLYYHAQEIANSYRQKRQKPRVAKI